MDKTGVYIGVDIGTQGVRLLMKDENGETRFTGDRKFMGADEDIRIRQNPEEWWKLLDALFSEAAAQLGESFYPRARFRAIGVTSTSGTIIPMSKENEILYGAIMYSDPRSAEFAPMVRRASEQYYDGRPGFKNFGSSCGLLKMLWFKNQFPEDYANRLGRFIHASDYITGKMTGRFGVTDHSNALKSGYDLHRDRWPEYLTEELALDPRFLSEVFPTTSRLAPLREEWVRRWKLSGTPLVTVGLTDGCASQFSTGAVQPGTWNTTIGTTLVLKGVTRTAVYDDAGSIYCHRHPDGYWMPGGASNTGADWVRDFSGAEIREGSRADVRIIPAPVFCYPLKMNGERFPFSNPEARGIFPDTADRQILFQAGLEGVAFIERYGYEKIEKLTGEKTEKIYSAGGGNQNEKWLSIRAAILGRPVIKAAQAGGALGAVLTAAAGDFENGLSGAAARLLPEGEIYLPEPRLSALYETRYQEFILFLKQKGIIDEE